MYVKSLTDSFVVVCTVLHRPVDTVGELVEAVDFY